MSGSAPIDKNAGSVERAIRKAVEAEHDELRKRLNNSTTMGLN